jgi:hypothetical protein
MEIQKLIICGGVLLLLAYIIAIIYLTAGVSFSDISINEYIPIMILITYLLSDVIESSIEDSTWGLVASTCMIILGLVLITNGYIHKHKKDKLEGLLYATIGIVLLMVRLQKRKNSKKNLIIVSKLFKLFVSIYTVN